MSASSSWRDNESQVKKLWIFEIFQGGRILMAIWQYFLKGGDWWGYRLLYGCKIRTVLRGSYVATSKAF
jgi:hypothetical protein